MSVQICSLIMLRVSHLYLVSLSFCTIPMWLFFKFQDFLELRSPRFMYAIVRYGSPLTSTRFFKYRYVGVTIGPAYKHSSEPYDTSRDIRNVSNT